MSVHQTPDGRWYVKFAKGTLPDHPNLTKEYYGRGDDAETRARARNAALGFGRKATACGKTFTYLANYYLQSKSGKIENRSIDTAFVHLEKHLIPFFGHMDAMEITDDRVDGYVTRRRTMTWRDGGGRGKEHVGVSRSTVRREITTLMAVLNFAVRRKLILYNPAAAYDMPKHDDAVIKPATQNEIRAILRHAAPHLRRFIYLAHYTACRPGDSELLSMKWHQIDIIERTIMIESAKKNGIESRIISMHDDLYKQVIKWHKEDCTLPEMPEYVCHYHGEHCSKIDKAWKSAKAKAKVLRRLRPYDIRHGSITAMLEAGKDLKSVSLIAGHKNPAMTMNRYQHQSTRLKEDAISGMVTLGDVGDVSEKGKGSKGNTGA